MGLLSLAGKDAREHGLAFIALGLGFVLVVLVALVTQKLGVFNMSGFEVVRFSLISIIPLITFIVGNRLIVREYTGGTRRFVEALPINRFMPLFVKYLIGLFYVGGLCVFVVLLAAGVASVAEDVNQRYLQLLLVKTAVIGLLFWSLVFFVSFTGRIRLVVYVAMGLTLAFLTNMPSFDETRLAPLAIMDNQLFVFERELFPWRDIVETIFISLGFVISGFALALFNEGSIAEQLGKPVSRRDMAAFVLLGMACLTVYTTLQKKWENETYELSGELVLRNQVPAIAVSYLDEKNRAQAEIIIELLQENLTALQADVDLSNIPRVQVALNTELEATEIEPELLFDGVLVTANFVNYDTYEHGMLRAIVMHHLLLSLTNARWDYETRHWLLDGFARWWAEGADSALESANNNELFAQALLAKRRFDFTENPLLIWQTITDQYGFEAADALSYSAILYLAQSKGKDKAVELAADYINESIADSSVESVERLLFADAVRFEKIIGQSLESFSKDWQQWLETYALQPEIAELIASVPHLQGQVKSVVDQTGAYRLEATYTDLANNAAITKGACVLRHQPASAYDLEAMIYERKRDRQDCVTNGVAHSIDSPYAPGDRAYVLLEYETEKFHRPIPLWVGRIHIK